MVLKEVLGFRPSGITSVQETELQLRLCRVSGPVAPGVLGILVPAPGIEPGHRGISNRCFTTKLCRRKWSGCGDLNPDKELGRLPCYR